MKDLFDWDGEDGGEHFSPDEEWPDGRYDADAEDDFDGYYGFDGFDGRDSMEDDYKEEYPEDGV